MSPEVPVAIAQVSVPPSAWPRLDFHVHRVPFHRFAERPQLLEQRRKRHFPRRLNLYFLCHAKPHLLNCAVCLTHRSSLNRTTSPDLAFFIFSSAPSFTR